jgi:serine/threonine protein kinase
MAPEIVKRKDYLGKPVDLWSMGVVLYALLCGRFPFSAKTYPELYKKIARGLFSIPDTLSHSARDLIKSLLVLDPEQRYTLPQAKAHPWLSGASDPPHGHSHGFGHGPRGLFFAKPSSASSGAGAMAGGEAGGEGATSKVRGAGAGGAAGEPERPRFLISPNPQNDLDKEVVHRMEAFGVPRDVLISCILHRKRNSLTTAYYLLRHATAKAKQAASQARTSAKDGLV